MIDGNQLREEFGRYLAEHKATRWGMDAALMHVCKIAYDAGKADGPGEHRNGAAETLDKLLTDRMKRSVKVEQVLQDVADGKRPVLTPYECRALSLSLGTPDESFSYAKAVLDTLYSQQFEIEVPDKWEYYYMDNNCPAADSGDPNCICWHDEGRGPYNNARHDDEDTFLEWRRVKAPAPADPDPLHLSRILHELAGAASLCWEPRPTGVFDSQLAIQFVEQAISEIRSRMTPAPAEAPMPQVYAERPTDYTGQIWIESQMRIYGAASRDREARMKRDAERYRWLRDVSVPPHNFYLSVPDEFAGVRYTPTEVDAAIDAAIDALRGEVK